MKFGKRLAAEASRRWRPFYLDYKALKRAVSKDVSNQDPTGASFEVVLRQELKKISAFYVEKEEELQAIMQGLASRHASCLDSFCQEVQDLKKYVVINYVAVIKSIKKRNRHLKEACTIPVSMLRAVDVLSCQYFYTSPVLATLSTRAEVLQSATTSAPPADVLEQQYQCPICLGVLHTPVVLTCAHRFCWGCLIAHCAAVAATQMHQGVDDDADADVWVDASEEVTPPTPTSVGTQSHAIPQHPHAIPQHPPTTNGGRKAVAPSVLVSEDEWDATTGPPTFDCPVCRKAHILDLDALQVDSTLSAYIEDLQHRSEGGDVQDVHDAPCTTTTMMVMEDTNTADHIVINHPPAVTTHHCPSAPIPIPAPSPTHQRSISGAAVAHTPLEHAVTECALSGSNTPACVTTPAPLINPPLCLPLLAHPEGPPLPQGPPSSASDTTHNPPLLPKQAPHHHGKLTVVLDLDGTLISSFTPRRAPALGPGVVGYVVGKGGRLNPAGVFVVERPGLREFFTRITAVAEVVLFTAGLEDYAKPIVDTLEARYGRVFSARLYRQATTACDVYPCIKDLSRLGRDMKRTLLVDDTPLAFYKQPNNGLPVYNFRSDPDDRILLEAVLPMLETLSAVPDIRPVLSSKFNMARWFVMQGLPVEGMRCGNNTAALQPKPPLAAPKPLPTHAVPPSTTPHPLPRPTSPPPCSPILLCCDFDKTITDCDAGERLVGELAPELLPMLTGIEMPANFIPMTNSVLAEMHRRGMGRDALLHALRGMGGEVPAASRAMLRWAAARDVDIRVLSDCNSVFIAHVLAAAKVAPYVREVCTNPATFHRVSLAVDDKGLYGGGVDNQTGNTQTGTTGIPSPHAHDDNENGVTSEKGIPSDKGIQHQPPPSAGVHRLVIAPLHPSHLPPHGCPLCPANLCKGAELRRLREESVAVGLPYKRIVYCGDGANDLCPALALGEQDVLLARSGHSLANMVEQHMGDNPVNGQRMAAKLALWSNHVELMALVQQAVNAVLLGST